MKSGGQATTSYPFATSAGSDWGAPQNVVSHALILVGIGKSAAPAACRSPSCQACSVVTPNSAAMPATNLAMYVGIASKSAILPAAIAARAPGDPAHG